MYNVFSYFINVLDIKPCDNVLDIGLFIDTIISCSISKLKEVLNFLTVLAQSFYGGSTKTRMALMIYGSTSPTVIRLENSKHIGRYFVTS